MDIGNYAKHAKYWDWSGHDRTDEFEYWRSYAERYGKNVLQPMCAWGDAGAYMARCGFTVTAVDITPEMIGEGKKRYGDIPNLTFALEDIRDFSLEMMQPADFCYLVDLGHILTLGDVRAVFASVSRHMRAGGGFVIENSLPPRESSYHPRETYLPLKQTHPGLKVWKTGETTVDAATGRYYISQTFYAADEAGGILEQFDHEFYLQYYEREALTTALRDSGFEIAHEYRSREKEPWREGDGFWVAEAVKVREAEQERRRDISLSDF